jgi:hypothetical protein
MFRLLVLVVAVVVKTAFDCDVLVAANDGFESALEGLNEDTDCVSSSPRARVARYLFIVAFI